MYTASTSNALPCRYATARISALPVFASGMAIFPFVPASCPSLVLHARCHVLLVGRLASTSQGEAEIVQTRTFVDKHLAMHDKPSTNFHTSYLGSPGHCAWPLASSHSLRHLLEVSEALLHVLPQEPRLLYLDSSSCQ